MGTTTPGYALDIGNNGNLNVAGKNIYLGGVQRLTDTLNASYTILKPQNNIFATYTGADTKILALDSTANYGAAIGATSTGNTYGWVDAYGTGGAVNLVLQSGQNSVGNVGIGRNIPVAKLDVGGTIVGTAPIASFSGKTSFAGLVVDNSGAGDLFTASSSGLNRFVITQAGNVGYWDNVPSERARKLGRFAVPIGRG